MHKSIAIVLAAITVSLSAAVCGATTSLTAPALAETSGGGGSWSVQSSGSAAYLIGVAFPDATHGWVVGEDGAILATTDGGATWSAQSSGTSVQLEDVSFPDATHGWAVGQDGTILATTDGGVTWSAQDSGSSAVGLSGVSFPDVTHGCAVGGGTILVTTDGGATWKEQYSDAAAQFWGVAFTDANHGWVVGHTYAFAANTKNGGGTILATSDGGATWSTHDSGSGTDLYDVAFTDATHGWVVGQNGAYTYEETGFSTVISATTDGGAHWSAQDVGGTTGLRGVVFPDATHGWAVGGDPTILATTDGGVTWSAQDSGSSAVGLSGVAFPDATHGWAVGGDGTILAYNATAPAGAAGSKGVAVWLIAAAVIAAAIIGGLGVALALRRRRATSVAVAAGHPAPDPRGPIGGISQPDPAQASGERAHYCGMCGSQVGATSAHCASCGAKVIR